MNTVHKDKGGGKGGKGTVGGGGAKGNSNGNDKNGLQGAQEKEQEEKQQLEPELEIGAQPQPQHNLQLPAQLVPGCMLVPQEIGNDNNHSRSRQSEGPGDERTGII